MPTPFDIDSIQEDIQWLLKLGPRPYRSMAAQKAALGVKKRLVSAGWDTQQIQMSGNVVACRGKGHYLFLAHTDTVPGSPGAIDNAAAVATLIELARKTQALDLCLAFPVGEEFGFLGSIQLARLIDKWHPNPKDLKLVVALDLVGHGSLSITGLSRSWDTPQLHWLSGFPEIDSEYGYQIVSRALPQMERSDHKPFAEAGYLSAHLLGRGSDGVFPYYHQREDTKTEPEALETLIHTLEAIATSTPPPQPQASFQNASLYQSGIAIPSVAIWSILIVGIGAGIYDIQSFKDSARAILKGFLFLLCSSLLSLALTQTGLFSSSLEENTTWSNVRFPATGWWNAAPAVFVLSILLLFWMRWKLKPSGSASLLCAMAALIGLVIDPLFALPFAIAALLARIWPPFAVFGALYWLQPAILRELSFHAILPSFLWPILFILLLPVFGGKHARN